MSHPAQIKFLKEVKKKYPQYFKEVRVVDIGSLNVNGCNKPFFERCLYDGVDIVKGDNVDIVARGHDFLRGMEKCFHVVISTEALEHDMFWQATLTSMYSALRDGGLMVITAAGDGREEHGTSEFHPTLSPATNDYYCNISNEMFSNALPPKLFTTYYLAQNNTDIQFYGIKTPSQLKPYPKNIFIRINNARRYYSETITELKKSNSFNQIFTRLAVMRGSIRELFT